MKRRANAVANAAIPLTDDDHAAAIAEFARATDSSVWANFGTLQKLSQACVINLDTRYLCLLQNVASFDKLSRINQIYNRWAPPCLPFCPVVEIPNLLGGHE